MEIPEPSERDRGMDLVRAYRWLSGNVGEYDDPVDGYPMLTPSMLGVIRRCAAAERDRDELRVRLEEANGFLDRSGSAMRF